MEYPTIITAKIPIYGKSILIFIIAITKKNIPPIKKKYPKKFKPWSPSLRFAFNVFKSLGTFSEIKTHLNIISKF
jgi:hypothetical protein